MKFLDYITAKAQSLYWNETLSAKSEKPFVGEELFPNRKQPGIKLEWVKGANQQAVALHLSAFDAKVLKRNRIGFSSMSANMPFFKDSLDIDEELRQKLLVAESSNVNYIQELIRRIFDDNNTLIKSAAVTREIRAFDSDMQVWQTSFHDHIIRNQADYERIWLYIEVNPARWMDDCFYIPQTAQ